MADKPFKKVFENRQNLKLNVLIRNIILQSLSLQISISLAINVRQHLNEEKSIFTYIVQLHCEQIKLSSNL